MDKSFIGDHDVTLDDAGRIAIPRLFRKQLDNDQVILTRGADSCIWLYTVEYWLMRRESLAAIADPDTAEGREIRRRYFANAHRVDIDKQGRVLPPPGLREFAGLTKDCKVVGQDEYIEIWDRERWEQKAISQDRFDAISEAFARKKNEREMRNAGNSSHSGFAGGDHTIPRAEGQG